MTSTKREEAVSRVMDAVIYRRPSCGRRVFDAIFATGTDLTCSRSTIRSGISRKEGKNV
jgi:hypothetical protein